MTRALKIQRMLWGLPILAMALLFVDAYFGHIRLPMSWLIFTLALGAAWLGFDLWARSTPGRSVLTPWPISRTDAHKHPVLLSVLFWGLMAALVIVLIQINRSESHWSLRQNALFFEITLALLVGYNLLVAFVRRMRSRGRNPADS